MAYEQKNMEGALWRNEKRTKDGDAHATGYAAIDGRKVWIKAWTNDGQKGKWQKLSFKWADEGARDIREHHNQDARNMDDDGDLPF